MTGLLAAESFAALGTTATLIVTEPSAAGECRSVLRDELSAIDLSCSRFRSDSEITRLNRSAGHGPVEVSPLLLDAVDQALRAARLTDGRVDPTVGAALVMIGYDRDFTHIAPDGPALALKARPVPGWRAVTVDRYRSTVRLEAGVQLDLGATAKAFAADRAAARAAASTGAGVLVSLGGDIAVAGPPPTGGWPVRVSPDHADPLDGPGPVIAVLAGGLATSSTTVRRWRRGQAELHHLIDPSTSAPVAGYWRLATVAAGSCLDANIASCAAMVLGPDAPAWLADRRLPARLERPDGSLSLVGGWPEETPACC